MKNYTAEQLQQNYDKFIEALKKVFKGERLEKLLHMYSENELGQELAAVRLLVVNLIFIMLMLVVTLTTY